MVSDSQADQIRAICHDYKSLQERVIDAEQTIAAAEKNAAAAAQKAAKTKADLLKRNSELLEKNKQFAASAAASSRKRSSTSAAGGGLAPADAGASPRTPVSRQSHPAHGTSGVVHPDRAAQVQGANRGASAAASSAARPKHAGPASHAAGPSNPPAVAHPADRCLVATNLGLRSGLHVWQATVSITQLLTEEGLIIRSDRGATDPETVWKISGTVLPIQWKVVFKTAQAATTVFDRWAAAPTPCAGTCRLRRFHARSGAAASEQAQPAQVSPLDRQRSEPESQGASKRQRMEPSTSTPRRSCRGALRPAGTASATIRANAGLPAAGCSISAAADAAPRRSAVPRWPTCVYGPAGCVRTAADGIRIVRPAADALRAASSSPRWPMFSRLRCSDRLRRPSTTTDRRTHSGYPPHAFGRGL